MNLVQLMTEIDRIIEHVVAAVGDTTVCGKLVEIGSVIVILGAPLTCGLPGMEAVSL